VFWYFNAIAFFSSVVALFMSLGMTVTGRYVMERPTYRSSSMSFASHMLQLAAISTLAAFCCAAFVALPYNHARNITIVGLVIVAYMGGTFFYFSVRSALVERLTRVTSPS
jgi:hypothetical protein